MTNAAGKDHGESANPDEVLAGTDWAVLEHAYGQADDVPAMLGALLDQDRRVRSQALDWLCGVVFHQNTLYPATVPAALYVAAVLSDPRTERPVDKQSHRFPGSMRAELLGWLGSIAGEATDEAAAIRRRMGFPPEEYPPFVRICEIRPQLYRAIAAFLTDADHHVQEAAIAACIPLLDDSRLSPHRAVLAPMLREVLGVSGLWQHRERAIEALESWGEDATGLVGQTDPFLFCNSEIESTGWGITRRCEDSAPPF